MGLNRNVFQQRLNSVCTAFKVCRHLCEQRSQGSHIESSLPPFSCFMLFNCLCYISRNPLSSYMPYICPLRYLIACILTMFKEGGGAWRENESRRERKGRVTLWAAQVVRRRRAVGLAVWAAAHLKLHCCSRTTYKQTNTHTYTHSHTFVHANLDIIHGCPLCFIIKALSGCAGSEGENMNQIKQIVWCVKDRHSSSKVLKLLLPMDWQGRRVAARNERSPSFITLLSSARNEVFPKACIIVYARSPCQHVRCQLNK